ncbi:hypothetical protein P7C73_g35, partial [Tremellales sp. Uapishka_1]
MLAKTAFPTFFLLLAAFILLLLVTLSVPIIKTIYLLHIEGGSVGSASTAANVGVFGTCYKGGSVRILGDTISTTAECTHPKVGYTLDPTFFGENVDSRFQSAVAKGVSGALILNPIACGLAGISLLLAFVAWLFGWRIFEILTLLTLFLSALLAWIVWAIDLALVLIARHRIKDYSNNVFTGHIGNAVWLGLAAAIILSFAICTATCGVFGRYSSRYTDRNAPAATTTGLPAPGEKGYRKRRFWQRKTDPTYRGTY